MKVLPLVVGLLAVLGSVQAQLTYSSFHGDFSSLNAPTDGLPLSSLITVANYHGCKTWEQERCVECSQGFYFNDKGVCCEVDPLCSVFNRAQGVCLECYQGYNVVDNCCKAAEIDKGCAKWDGNLCIECSRRWVFNDQSVCVPVSDDCRTWNERGACLTCYSGYMLNSNQCLVDENPFAPEREDPLCATWAGNTCIECAERAYFNANDKCQPVSDQCQTYDPLDGFCLSCYGGYTLNNGRCEKSAVTEPSDAGCALWNEDMTVCVECSKRHYFNNNQVCNPVSDLCATWNNNNGACLSCYKGYDLSNGICSVSTRNERPSDVGCAQWDWDRQLCLQCSEKWVFNSQRVCVPVSDKCASHNGNGACASCYEGYRLENGRCVEAPVQEVSDKGCASWDWKNQVCLKCAEKHVFGANGRCIDVSDQCASHDEFGACTSCYEGYNLDLGRCVEAPERKPSDVGCGSWDWKNQICLKCSENWVFNNNGVCVPVSDQCASHNEFGACTSCYEGYNLNNGRCVEAPEERPSDEGCATWDWKNRRCLECSEHWVFNSNGRCVVVSDQCASHDDSGACTSCYVGYNLQSGSCVKAPEERPSDVGCATWDWTGKRCLECSENWVFNSQGRCVVVSDQCASHDASGSCTSCYKGYDLNNGRCELAPERKPSDVGCAQWDWDRQLCLQCSKRWVFNSQRVCVPVSDQCATHNGAGDCASCYKGYRLDNGRCVEAPVQGVSDVGCGTWDWDNQVCLECSKNWVFNSNRVCVPVSDHCASHDASGACTSCYKGFLLNNGKCEMGNSLCKDNDSNGACTSCYTGYLLNHGSCVPVSKLANLALYYAMCCPERLAELGMDVGAVAP